ncbi:MAG: HEPN domain-containing protein [Candidatus Kapabacteria bacterium]|jgi:hypothetical protein|nr:HEPN domain-containing protein [Candidatus Kapabacteria bacterium]
MNNEFFLKAENNLRAAKVLYELDLFDASVNRAYYAAFHAALAVIEIKGLQPHTDHAKVQATFNSEVIRRSKHITISYKHYLLTMQDARNLADYKPFAIAKQRATKQIKMAQEFLNIIRVEMNQ